MVKMKVSRPTGRPREIESPILVHLYLPQKSVDALDEKASELGVTRSEVFRTIVDWYFTSEVERIRKMRDLEMQNKNLKEMLANAEKKIAKLEEKLRKYEPPTPPKKFIIPPSPRHLGERRRPIILSASFDELKEESVGSPEKQRVLELLKSYKQASVLEKGKIIRELNELLIDIDDDVFREKVRCVLEKMKKKL